MGISRDRGYPAGPKRKKNVLKCRIIKKERKDKHRHKKKQSVLKTDQRKCVHMNERNLKCSKSCL